MISKWRIDYVRYNRPDFADKAWADSGREADRIASALRKLKHISDVVITPPDLITGEQHDH